MFSGDFRGYTTSLEVLASVWRFTETLQATYYKGCRADYTETSILDAGYREERGTPLHLIPTLPTLSVWSR